MHRRLLLAASILAICLAVTAVQAQEEFTFTEKHKAQSAYQKAIQWKTNAKREGTTLTEENLLEIWAYADAYKQAVTNVPHEGDGFVFHSEALDAGKRLFELETILTPEEVAALGPLVERIFGYYTGT